MVTGLKVTGVKATGLTDKIIKVTGLKEIRAGHKIIKAERGIGIIQAHNLSIGIR